MKEFPYILQCFILLTANLKLPTSLVKTTEFCLHFGGIWENCQLRLFARFFSLNCKRQRGLL